MLFVFNKFWKSVLLLSLSLTSLSVIGYEFTVVTLLSLIFCANFTTSSTHL